MEQSPLRLIKRKQEYLRKSEINGLPTGLPGIYGLYRYPTLNAEAMTPDALQRLMRHKSYQTTQRYVNMAQQVNQAVQRLHVPEVLRPKA